MNKNIIEALSQYDFEYDKNYGYGHIDGYEVNVYNNPLSVGPLFVFSTYLSMQDKQKFVLTMMAYGYKLVTVKGFDFGVIVQVGVMTGRGFKKKLDLVLPKILHTLANLNAPKADICPKTGKVLDSLNSKTIFLPDSKIKITLSDEGVETTNQEITKNEGDYKNAPNNYLAGLGGILIGALAGVLLVYIFSLIGMISAFAPIVSILLGTFLYRKFKAKPNYMMIVMSFVVTLIAISFALLYLYTMGATGLVAEKGLSYTGINALKYCLNNDAEFKKSFTIDMVTNVVFIILAEGITVYGLIRSIKRPKKIQ